MVYRWRTPALANLGWSPRMHGRRFACGRASCGMQCDTAWRCTSSPHWRPKLSVVHSNNESASLVVVEYVSTTAWLGWWEERGRANVAAVF
jgi:hypothetical protein